MLLLVGVTCCTMFAITAKQQDQVLHEPTATKWWRSGFMTYLTYQALNEIAHTVFSTKYWSLARKLERICKQEDDSTGLDKPAIGIFCAQVVLILACTGFQQYASMYPVSKGELMTVADRLACIPSFIEAGLLILAFVKMRSLGMQKLRF